MPDPDATSRLDGAASDAGRPETQPQPLVPGAGAEPGHFVPFLQAAALAFLGLLALGAVFVVALKAQFPDVGAGSDPIDVLTSIVILALATLRVPIHVGELTFTVLPLGALAAFGAVVMWSCHSAVRAAPPRRSFIVGGVFGLIAMVAALVFRFRFKQDPIYAGSVGALLLGVVWTGAFAALSFASEGTSLRGVVVDLRDGLASRRPVVYEGVRAGAMMLALAALGAAAAGLVWAIVVLARGGGPQNLDVGDLFAALVYLIAFAPNLVVMVMAVSLGAPVDIGAGLTLAGRVRGNVRELSVFDGGGALWLLMAIPAAACTTVGYWARKNTADAKGMVVVIVTAATVFACCLGLLAWLGEARLGAKLASARGFGLIAARPWAVLLMGWLWAVVGGAAGWTIAERRR